MKRFLLPIVVALGSITGLAIVPTVAQAAPITFTYCRGDVEWGGSFKGSLRGAGTLAPDNDVYAYIQSLSALGFKVTNHAPSQDYRVSDNDLRVNWRFTNIWGDDVYRWFRCWRDSTGYHDGRS